MRDGTACMGMKKDGYQGDFTVARRDRVENSLR